MTNSTTLKLPDELKARIAPLAKAAGKTPHAWMLEALATQAGLAEMRRSFIEDALTSAAEVDAGGPLYAMEDVHAYIRGRTRRRTVARPKPLRPGKA
ncbi:MAG TPA: CopG family transcriptional regulator [Burkholderiales bacterium]|nr:CopG family transcriptional regulator [Burkholderiales bacterium]